MRRAVLNGLASLILILGILGTTLGCGGKADKPSPPAAPAGVLATAGKGQVSLGWNPVTNATGYKIYYSTVSGSGTS